MPVRLADFGNLNWMTAMKRKIRKSDKKAVRGFTLVELLVVISIISLLMSILLPSLQRARAQARSILCRNKQKQLGIATHTYAEDNNNEYLLHEWASNPSDDNYDPDTLGYFYGRIAPYLSIDDSKHPHHVGPEMRCPSGEADKYYGNGYYYDNSATDYGLQSATSGYDNQGNPIPIKIYQIKSPAEFGMFFDFLYGYLKSNEMEVLTNGSVWGGKWDQTINTIWFAENRGIVPDLLQRLYRHNSGINVVYADTHVEAVSGPKITRDWLKEPYQDIWWEAIASPTSTGWENRNK